MFFYSENTPRGILKRIFTDLPVEPFPHQFGAEPRFLASGGRITVVYTNSIKLPRLPARYLVRPYVAEAVLYDKPIHCAKTIQPDLTIPDASINAPANSERVDEPRVSTEVVEPLTPEERAQSMVSESDPHNVRDFPWMESEFLKN